MKEIHLDNNQFLEDKSGTWESTSSLEMGDGKHIRFTAIDKNYSLSITTPDGSKDSLNVPTNVDYERYEIKGKKGDQHVKVECHRRQEAEKLLGLREQELRELCAPFSPGRLLLLCRPEG